MSRDLHLLIALGTIWAMGSLFYVWSPSQVREVRDERLGAVVDHMVRSEEPDIVFLGSSKTQTGIHAPLLSQRMEATVWNLGVNWFGQDLRLSQLKTLLKHHRPKLVVLEVSFLRRYHQHVNFKRMAPMEDVLGASFHPAWFADIIYAVPRSFTQDLRASFAPRPWGGLELHGYDPNPMAPEQVVQTRTYFEALKASRAPIRAEQIDLPSGRKGELVQLAMGPELLTIQEMAQRCREKGVGFCLLPLPKFLMSRMGEKQLEQWKAMAPVMLLPPDVLDDPSYWYDEAHLNDTGAKGLAQWLVPALRERLQNVSP